MLKQHSLKFKWAFSEFGFDGIRILICFNGLHKIYNKYNNIRSNAYYIWIIFASMKY